MMVTYRLRGKYRCWQCRREESVRAKLREYHATWNCSNCGAANGVFIDQVRIPVGTQLFQAGCDLIKGNECDLAAVLLVAAVDASLGIGIRYLTNWRAIERAEAPPSQDEIDEELRCMGYKDKRKKFEHLAGVTMRGEIQRLYKEGKIAQGELAKYNGLKKGIERLERERNGLVHMGEPVNDEVVRESVAAVKKTVYVLEEMYRSTYGMKRPLMKEPLSLARRSKGKRTKGAGKKRLRNKKQLPYGGGNGIV